MNILWTKPSLSRDFALLSGLIIFILIIVSIWVSYETYEAHSDRIIKQLEGEATRVDRAMIIEIERAHYLIESLGRQIAQMDTENLDSVALLLKSFDTNTLANNVLTFVDPTQSVVVSSNRGVLSKPVDVSDRDYIKKSLAESWKAHIGRPIQGRVSEKWVLPIGVGITDNSGQFRGTIAISLDIASLSRELQNVIKKSGISFAIFSKTLVLLTDNDGFITTNESFMNQLKHLDFSKKASGVLGMGSLISPREIYAYYETSASYPYVIVLGYDNNVSISTIFNLILPRILQLSLMAIFMLSLLWMVRVRVIQPVMELTEISAGVGRGEGFHPITQNSPLEVELLAQEIRKISEYLLERKRIATENEHKNLMLRKNKEHAELVNRIKSEFLSSMSHEFRTPLNTIIGFSEIMKNELYGPMPNPQYGQYAQDIHETSRYLQELLEDILLLSKAESDIHELQEKPLDVKLLTLRCIRAVSDKLGQLGITVDVQASDSLPKLLMDETRLKLIITNLLSNTAKLATAHGAVTVRIFTEKSKSNQNVFVIAFSDGQESGKIGSNAIEQRNKSSKRPRIEIEGLSIPLSKALVAMHQATLTMSPGSMGKPTVLSVQFGSERIVY